MVQGLERRGLSGPAGPQDCGLAASGAGGLPSPLLRPPPARGFLVGPGDTGEEPQPWATQQGNLELAPGHRVAAGQAGDTVGLRPLSTPSRSGAGDEVTLGAGAQSVLGTERVGESVGERQRQRQSLARHR